MTDAPFKQPRLLVNDEWRSRLRNQAINNTVLAFDNWINYIRSMDQIANGWGDNNCVSGRQASTGGLPIPS